ncbi:hypothetical protein [Streptomyces marincola]|uniref:hypothetical protein n=1 Tax=Streptomyces marincola TaxID=2878388 RepID=UPI0021004627|nr:hypothetical protein [Streptomyces marincola]
MKTAVRSSSAALSPAAARSAPPTGPRAVGSHRRTWARSASSAARARRTTSSR